MAFEGFRTRKRSGQSFSSATVTAVTWDEAEFDTTGGFASDVFTVPAELDGRYAEFFLGMICRVTGQSVAIYLQKSTDGGSNWSFETQKLGEDVAGLASFTSLRSGPVLLEEDHQYRMAAFTSGTSGAGNSEGTFFAMRLLPVGFRGFRAGVSGTQSISSATETALNFGTEVFDTEAAFASNVFTVPAALDGAFMSFTAGVRLSASEDGYLSIQRSQNGGSSWASVGKLSVGGTTGAVVDTQPLVVAEGEIFRAVFYSSTAAEISNDNRSFFSGQEHPGPVGLSAPAEVLDGFEISIGATTAFSDEVEQAIEFSRKVRGPFNCISGKAFVVPAALDGVYMSFFAGLAGVSAVQVRLKIMRSQDDGSSWQVLATANADTLTGSVSYVTAHTGPIVISEGEQLACFATFNGAEVIPFNGVSFFRGMVEG